MISKICVYILLIANTTFDNLQGFDEVVSQLFFGLNVKDAKDHVLDSLLSIKEFKHRVVDKPYSWTANHFMNSKKTVWQQHHQFTFFKSPLPGMKIDSGVVNLSIGKTTDSTLLSTYSWLVFFNSKAEVKHYYDEMRKKFAKTGAIHEQTKIATGDIMDVYTASRNENFEEIAMTWTKSPYFNKYYILIDLIGSQHEY